MEKRLEVARELLKRLQLLRDEAREIERLLASLEISDSQIINDAEADNAARRVKEIIDEQVLHFAARIDFRDEYYRFIRAIDGDTIVVEPPPALREWMTDIHVRLYGLETPELWMEHGSEYRSHLEELCAIDAGCRLMIIWERERAGTTYQGYPLDSFERSIGHVFYREDAGRYVYINGLMQLLKYSSLDRDGKSLLRGRRHLNTPNLLTWYDRCPSWDYRTERLSETLRSILALAPPACLLTYSHVPSLDPRDPEFADKINSVMLASWRFGCPIEQALLRDKESLRAQERAQQASPFDIPLTYTRAWAEQQDRFK